ncbi:extracellular solute-binding protein [Agrobacterium vitis]|uniref:Extracellular solute-binding protein n=1 Tax=Agrobacterium vitis TaxID=373 RepID=A0AAE4WJ46_AGRVI|nr:extracellular solute-binding protein [Agrobacterium vitis]MCF1501803.1 extracellular solute-binding protein [Allorhizobium sp. Av2]MCM2443305.1 extracellular solute-binding protein [Agrobacterium vitis]MUZ60933.1 extracellular solute-binding protein [Agrobacterium vitis]MVA69209.1 extracellular solute-binding protein [Agrobacterium vitis]MVA90222.1 extracellular solute-binding protein [Agrobacterium vitis]
MNERGILTRRSLLRASAAVTAAAVMSVREGGPALAQAKLSGKVVYWGGLIFSDEANKLLKSTVTAWGEANGVETEVVMINQNETVQKVSAAVASGTLPDAMDINLDLLLPLSLQGVFLALDDVYDAVGNQQGGWYEGVDRAVSGQAFPGGRTGIPFGVSGNLLLRRRDILEASGYKYAPRTWDELAQQAAAVSGKGVYGLGLALSNVPDGNVQINVLQSFGGRIADDAGRTVTIRSAETRAYLRWIKENWDKGLFPPGNVIWDGAGDNQAYLSGQAAFIANTGSVGIAARNQDPELYAGSAFTPLPAGPKGLISPFIPQLRAIPKSSQNAGAAKALVLHLSQPEFLREYYKVAIYGPVLKSQKAFEAFNGGDPILTALLELAETGTAPAYPDVYNAAYGEMLNNFVVPKMVQRVVIDNWDFDRAMDEAQGQAEGIYGKYN